MNESRHAMQYWCIMIGTLGLKALSTLLVAEELRGQPRFSTQAFKFVRPIRQYCGLNNWCYINCWSCPAKLCLHLMPAFLLNKGFFSFCIAWWALYKIGRDSYYIMTRYNLAKRVERKMNCYLKALKVLQTPAVLHTAVAALPALSENSLFGSIELIA